MIGILMIVIAPIATIAVGLYIVLATYRYVLAEFGSREDSGR